MMCLANSRFVNAERSPGAPLGFLRAVLALVLWLAAVGGAGACSIPVFRYALDRWPADAYRLEVSPADASKEPVAKFLRNLGTSSPYNIEGVRLPSDASGPSRLLYPPGKDGQRAEVWSGVLDVEVLDRLVRSAAREKIASQMIAGASGVWVFVESGDKASDDAAVVRLEKRLRYLEQVAQLPRIDPNDPTSKLGPGPKLEVKFGVLRIKKDDPAERALLSMLAGPKLAGQPDKGSWLAAVFGRGRVLGSWPAEGFGDEQVEEVCLFLLGACSCQVKNLNPGWDLLLSVHWDDELDKADKLASAVTRGAQQPPVLPQEPPPAETVTIQGNQAVMTGAAGDKPMTDRPGNSDADGKSVNWALMGGMAVLMLAGVCFWKARS